MKPPDPSLSGAPLRILVMGGYAPSLINFRGDLLREFVRLGHDVVAMAPEADVGIAARLDALGVRYVALPMRRTGINPAGELSLLWRYFRAIRAVRPDLVLAYTVKPVVYGLLAAALAGVPRRYALITGLGYAFGTGSLARRILGWVVSGLHRLALRKAGSVVFQNPDDARLFQSRGIVRASSIAVVNGSGVDTQHFAYVPPPPPGMVFLLVARLLKEKGIAEYAEAARQLRREHPQVEFRLAGYHDPGPSAIALGDVRQWEESGAVDFIGPLEDVRGELAQCSVFVLPSYREGTPRTVLEAMSVGRPVITTDVPGCRETVVDGDNGYLVPAKDVSGLVAAMRRFIADPASVERMGRRGRAIAEQKYDVRLVNRSMLDAMGMPTGAPP